MLGRQFLAAIMGMGAMLRNMRSEALRGDQPMRPVSINSTRSRIAGKPGKAGDKLLKRYRNGTLTLRNFTKGGYGETLRDDLNNKEFERQREKRVVAEMRKSKSLYVQKVQRGTHVYGAPALAYRTKTA